MNRHLSYYNDGLAKIKDDKTNIHVKFFGSKDTNFMVLNADSIPVFIEFLQDTLNKLNNK